ncbi:uncharacterized protein LOC130771251 isoform X2 [Actinidia eriantha]|uniref:uncharacterized protein LOC130771251 isoform X2 n=1 Tax=Actinidia eriantha TaxID=165200 RepID=UPI0025896C82|nr:uncharacterized protein LOC130771251 isoform X2 [Actinidia eriantha]
MIPPCPLFEYAHMCSLRQPAFDLIQTILVSDAVVLVTSMLDCHTPPIISKSTSFELNDEDEDEGLLFAHDSEEKDDSCWNEFSVQSRFTSQEFGEWMSIPMLWHYVFVEIDPLIFPVSFFKAVFWALSRLTTVEPENSTEMALPVINCLSICAPEISHLFGWKVPSGYDDGGDGKEWKNSIKISTLCTLLMKTFKRMRGRLVAASLNKYPTRVAMLIVCSFSTPAPLIHLPFFLD